jgi:glyoxylase-like metal-dependent hydrolase (beta-lactamase superfamily II)
MIKVKTFIFNPFQENTYVVSDETGACVVIDPGCSSPRENEDIEQYISLNNLNVEKVLCTHLHVDHVLGNAFFSERYGLNPWAHSGDKELYAQVKGQAEMFGLIMENEPPQLQGELKEGETVTFGSTRFEVLYVPGHSPGGICFYSKADDIVFVGDCLFNGSIGRTDLWGGDHALLLSRIKSELLTLPEETVAYPGHGPHTTIGEEKAGNPFLT